jgi:hypothetical protein
LREAAGQIRGLPGGAFRASRTTHLKWTFGATVALAVFLGFVGAFGTLILPLWLRVLTFLWLGFGCTALALACRWITGLVPRLAMRPLARHATVALMMTPLTAVWIWVAVGWAFLPGGPRPSQLPLYLGYAFGMCVAMGALSWVIFHPRRFRAAPEAAPEPAPATRFESRLPFRLQGAALWAVEADDHYLKVRTSKGSDLILMRLSDALHELNGLDGLQTHRSWWVARAGVADVARRQGKPVLVLKDGGEAPVSRTYASALREAGWLQARPGAARTKT